MSTRHNTYLHDQSDQYERLDREAAEGERYYCGECRRYHLPSRERNMRCPECGLPTVPVYPHVESREQIAALWQAQYDQRMKIRIPFSFATYRVDIGCLKSKRLN